VVFRLYWRLFILGHYCSSGSRHQWLKKALFLGNSFAKIPHATGQRPVANVKFHSFTVLIQTDTKIAAYGPACTGREDAAVN
jgi:hypothetical protein